MSSSLRVLHMDPSPWPLQDKLADATGYLLSPSFVLRRADPPHAHPVIFVRAPPRARSHGDLRETIDSPGHKLTACAYERIAAHGV